MKIAIVGGGISSLASAFYLESANKDLSIDIYESQARLGGTMKTQNIDGFLFEEGVNGFLTNKPYMLDLVKSAQAEHLLLASNDLARVRYIYTDKLHLLPETPQAFLRTKLLSLKAKLRVLAEPFIKAKTDAEDETLESFGNRRVGKEMTDIFLNAMVAGVFASSPEKISVKSAFPLVVNLEQKYGGLFRGMLKKRKKTPGPGGILMSFNGGVSTFIEHLATKLSANIFLNTKVEKIEKSNEKYKVISGEKSQVYDKIILATPAFISASLIADLDKNLAEKLAQIEYSPLGVIGFGYEKLDHNLNGFGLLTPALAQQNILGVLWDSSVFTDRAPNSNQCLRTMIGGQRDKHLLQKTEQELIEIAKEGIKTTMGASASPVAVFTKIYQQAIPNYGLGHSLLIDEIFTKLEAHSGLYLNSNAYKGVALNDCVKNSKICAEKILAEI